MILWYSFLENLLPFSWTQYAFMKNALLAILLIAPVFGMMSTMVVNNRMAFFSDSIGHSVLTGIAIGALLGIGNPLWSMLLFAIAFSVLVVVVKNANTASTDTVIGVFSSTAVALGLVILSKKGFNKYTVYLIGDILGIRPSEIVLLIIVLVGVLLFWVFLFNKLLVVSINQSIAGSRGIRVLWMEIAFTAAVAVVVTISIRWVGLLIISSLLVLPAAAARNVAASIRQYHVISIAISYIAGVAGLILSFYLGTATGATIVLLCAGFFALTFLVGRRMV